MAGSPRWMIDRVFLGMILIIPFIPMPTLDHPAKYIAPVVISLVLYIYLIWFLGRKVRTSVPEDKSALLGFLLFFVMLVYLARILVNGEWGEVNHLAGRSLASLLMVALLSWMNLREVKVKDIFRPLFYGSVLLSLFVVFIGITGIPLFGADQVRPPRTFGITLPFYKTDAIPRSYGEFGIIMSASWAYFLNYRKDYPRLLRYLIAVSMLLAVAISQSRSAYMGTLMVTAGYFLLRFRATKRLVAALLVASLVMPVLINIVPRNLPVFRALVSEGQYQYNVDERYYEYTAAIKAVTENPTVFFVGVPHSEWTYYSRGMISEGEALHNHFLSMLVFFGIIGGLINLLVYILPIMNLVQTNSYAGKDISVILLASIGMLIGLNFYEGFFSMVAALIISCMWYSFRLFGGGEPVSDVER